MDEMPTYLAPCQAIVHFASTPDESTVRNWMSNGVPIRIGEKKGRLVLQHIPEGKRLLTTVAWIDEFKADHKLLRDYGNGNSRLESEAAVARMNEAIARVIWDVPASETPQ